jgi:phage major head subunit gpT-like protein
MALDTASKIANLRSLTQKFDQMVRAATPFYPRLTRLIQSNGRNEEYGIPGASPAMREWLGDRVFNQIRAANFTIENKAWENSLLISKFDLDDDRMGMYDMELEVLAAEASHHPDKLLMQAIVDAEATACFDSQYFFDTDHSWGASGTQSNDLTYDGSSTVTATEFLAAYHQARKALTGFKRDNGEPYNRPVIEGFSNLLVLVPPDLEVVANKGLRASVLGTDDNIVLDRPNIVCSPYLTDATKFYLFDLQGPLMPFVFQARQALRRQIKGLDDNETKDVKFMCDARYNIGYLAWWTGVLTTFT